MNFSHICLIMIAGGVLSFISGVIMLVVWHAW